MEAFSKVVAIIVLIIVLFMAPLLYFSAQHDRVLQTYVAAHTTEFVDNVRLQGKITQEMYNDYVATLSNTNMSFQITLEHTHVTDVPVFSETDGTLTGTSKYTSSVYEGDILHQLFTRDTLTPEEQAAGDKIGEYHFRKDDYFTVILKNTDNTMSQKLQSMLGASGAGFVIYYQYGGMIRDENF
ncbi:hypothetical protein AALB53_09070 [Lachnospiraceae bacterium 47-T17]